MEANSRPSPEVVGLPPVEIKPLGGRTKDITHREEEKKPEFKVNEKFTELLSFVARLLKGQKWGVGGSMGSVFQERSDRDTNVGDVDVYTTEEAMEKIKQVLWPSRVGDEKLDEERESVMADFPDIRTKYFIQYAVLSDLGRCTRIRICDFKTGKEIVEIFSGDGGIVQMDNEKMDSRRGKDKIVKVDGVENDIKALSIEDQTRSYIIITALESLRNDAFLEGKDRVFESLDGQQMEGSEKLSYNAKTVNRFVSLAKMPDLQSIGGIRKIFEPLKDYKNLPKEVMDEIWSFKEMLEDFCITNNEVDKIKPDGELLSGEDLAEILQKCVDKVVLVIEECSIEKQGEKIAKADIAGKNLDKVVTPLFKWLDENKRDGIEKKKSMELAGLVSSIERILANNQDLLLTLKCCLKYMVKQIKKALTPQINVGNK